MAKCIFTRVGFIDSNGDLKEESVVEKLSRDTGDRDKVQENLNQCKSAIGSNKDENPIKLYVCYKEKKLLNP